MHRTFVATSLLLAASAVMLLADEASACSPEGPLDAVAPTDGRKDVATTDSITTFIYAAVLLYRESDGSLVPLLDQSLEPPAARFVPTAPLLEGETYRVESEFTGAVLSHFTVGLGEDVSPPTFAGIDDVGFFYVCPPSSRATVLCKEYEGPLGRLELTYDLPEDDRTPAWELLYTYEIYEEEDLSTPWETYHRLGVPFTSSPDQSWYNIVADPITPDFEPDQRYCVRVTVQDLSGNTSGAERMACGDVVRVDCGAFSGGCACKLAPTSHPPLGPCLLLATFTVISASRSRWNWRTKLNAAKKPWWKFWS